jgi:hypothetical protein
VKAVPVLDQDAHDGVEVDAVEIEQAEDRLAPLHRVGLAQAGQERGEAAVPGRDVRSLREVRLVEFVEVAGAVDTVHLKEALVHLLDEQPLSVPLARAAVVDHPEPVRPRRQRAEIAEDLEAPVFHVGCHEARPAAAFLGDHVERAVASILLPFQEADFLSLG